MRIPKYLLIKNELKNEIISGVYTSGDKFYSEKELTHKFNVSSITVIRAIQELTNEGFLVRIQGKGTFISKARKRKLVEFSDVELFEISDDRVTVLSLEKNNHRDMLKELGLKSNQYYYKIVRIRSVNGLPYFHQESYIPARYIKKEKDLDYFTSIYYRFKKDFHINMNEQFSTEINQISLPTPVEVAEQLKIEVNIPTVRQIKKTTDLESNDVLEYVISHKKWDYYKIEFSTFNLY